MSTATHPNVAVVMSVFNGARYLREQIDSILAQEGVYLSLFVWNDGSNDATVEILASYGDRLTSWTGLNKGAAQGFLQAVELCDVAADYYSLSDSDDVWLPTKVIDAISELESQKPTGPALIATKMTLTDAELRPIGETPSPAVPLSFENALVQGGIGGASCVMNAKLWRIFRSRRPTTLVMHDGWLYLVASAFGQIFFSERSRILYRQHSYNVIGAAHGASAQWKRRLRWLGSKGDAQKEQAREFLKLFRDDLTVRQRNVAEQFAFPDQTMKGRVAFVIRPPVRFNSSKSRLLYSARVLLGRT